MDSNDSVDSSDDKARAMVIKWRSSDPGCVDFVCNFPFPPYFLDLDFVFAAMVKSEFNDMGFDEFYIRHRKITKPGYRDYANADCVIENLSWWFKEIGYALGKTSMTLQEFKDFLLKC